MPLRLGTQIRRLTNALAWVNVTTPVDLGALRGKVVLVHFWALSCQACKAQLHYLQDWRRKYGERLAIVSVHSPIEVEDMDDERVEDAVGELGIEHPVALDDEDGSLADLYDVHITPSYFLFDTEGRLRHYHAGTEAAGPVARALERQLGEGEDHAGV